MRRESRNKRDRAVHPRDDRPVAGVQIVADQLDQRGKRIFAAARRIGWSGDGLSRARTGQPVPGWHKYNSSDARYEKHILDMIRSIPTHEAEWRKLNEPAQ
jgi:hypothetical protein